MSIPTRPIVVVTGANGGVGYGICQRLLVQLSEESPSDSLPQQFSLDINPQEDSPTTYSGLTLVMACRSLKRAEKARAELLEFLDAHVDTLRSRPGYTGYAEKFKENVVIEVQYLDLALIKSVLDFAKAMKARYPYLSHLMCNAGVASFSGLHWPSVFQQLLHDPMSAITAPTFYLQHKGELSVDGLGWVWQCNLFGHYALFRELQPLLTDSPMRGRVVWCSSLEASPKFYDTEDWQLRNTEHSYESSKYQIDLIATTLDLQEAPQNNNHPPIRHFISQPGVCSTNVSQALVGPVLNLLKVLLFYIGRLFGSPHHTIDPFKAAIASVHLALVPLAYLAYFSSTKTPPVRFGAETDRWGDEHVGLTPVKAWLKHQDEGKALVDKCEELLQKFKNEESRPIDFESASERM